MWIALRNYFQMEKWCQKTFTKKTNDLLQKDDQSKYNSNKWRLQTVFQTSPQDDQVFFFMRRGRLITRNFDIVLDEILLKKIQNLNEHFFKLKLLIKFSVRSIWMRSRKQIFLLGDRQGLAEMFGWKPALSVNVSKRMFF